MLTLEIGGRFDGILGMIGALEVLRTIKDSGYKTRVSIAAINWTNEYTLPLLALFLSSLSSPSPLECHRNNY